MSHAFQVLFVLVGLHIQSNKLHNYVRHIFSLAGCYIKIKLPCPLLRQSANFSYVCHLPLLSHELLHLDVQLLHPVFMVDCYEIEIPERRVAFTVPHTSGRSKCNGGAGQPSGQCGRVARYHQAHIASGMQACRLPSLTARSNSPVLSDSTKQQIVGVPIHG